MNYMNLPVVKTTTINWKYVRDGDMLKRVDADPPRLVHFIDVGKMTFREIDTFINKMIESYNKKQPYAP